MLTEVANDLPKGWAWTQVKNVAKFIRGVSYRKNESSKSPETDYLPILRANNINKQLNFEDLVYVQRERVKEEQFVKGLDIIIAMSSGSKHLVGKAAQADQDFEGGFGTFCGLVRSSPQLDRKFIGLFFQSPVYRNEISRLSIGININNLRRENVESMLIPIPPLAEQHRIVAKLEMLFTQLDAAVDNLKKAQVQVHRYRQSLLKAAFEGELTREWRDGYAEKGRKDIGEVVQLKAVANLRREKVQPKDSSENLNFVGLKHIDSGVSILERWGDASEVKSTKARFYPNDVLYGKLRPYLDKAVIAEMEGMCSSDILVFTTNSKMIPRFLVYLLHSHPFRSHAIATSSGITLPRTSWNALGEFTFALPPLTEQEQIVFELERHLSVADEIEATIAAELTRAERLRQSILKHAFSGKLVPQDPNDEPASVLLEKIRDEKEQQQPKRKKTKTKVKIATSATQLSLPLD